MIQSFADADTEELFLTEKSRRFTAIARVALRKLIQLNQAVRLQDMIVPPGNRLEALHGDRFGQYAIRINAQWRLVFCWTETGPGRVAVVDYH